MHIVYPFKHCINKNTYRMYILVGYLGFNLRRPRGSSVHPVHPQESAATFDEIPCWTPLADALLATLHMDDDVSSGPKRQGEKKHMKGGGGWMF